MPFGGTPNWLSRAPAFSSTRHGAALPRRSEVTWGGMESPSRKSGISAIMSTSVKRAGGRSRGCWRVHFQPVWIAILSKQAFDRIQLPCRSEERTLRAEPLQARPHPVPVPVGVRPVEPGFLVRKVHLTLFKAAEAIRRGVRSVSPGYRWEGGLVVGDGGSIPFDRQRLRRQVSSKRLT
jgi:hypothetical protein